MPIADLFHRRKMQLSDLVLISLLLSLLNVPVDCVDIKDTLEQQN